MCFHATAGTAEVLFIARISTVLFNVFIYKIIFVNGRSKGTETNNLIHRFMLPCLARRGLQDKVGNRLVITNTVHDLEWLKMCRLT